MRAALAYGLTALLVAGCAIGPRLSDLDPPRPGIARLPEVPFHPQQALHCGPASLLTVLEASGAAPAYARVAERVFVPDLGGSLQVEMAAAARHFGRIPYPVDPTLEGVADQVDAGFPVLVLQNLGLKAVPVWHYAVVIGYGRPRERLMMRSGEHPELETPTGRWLRQWDRAGRWGLVMLEPGELPADPDPVRLRRALADFDAGGEPRERERAWQAAAARWPDDPVTWLGIGNARYQADDDSGAEAAFRQALDADPEHWPARLNLATLLAESERPCRALEVSEFPMPPDHPLSARTAELVRDLRAACPAAPD